MQVLGAMAERNPRMQENSNWQAASVGIARLLRDVESLNGAVVEVDFVAEVARLEAMSDQSDMWWQPLLSLRPASETEPEVLREAFSGRSMGHVQKRRTRAA
jgi:hypothetical protein